MSDVVPVSPGSGANILGDNIGADFAQAIKILLGGDGVDGGFVSSSNPLPVSGPLTDGQLRATPVPISGTGIGVTGPLTDTQLRASAVPVSGPLTDTQLRASAVPVSAASLPLPSGAATEATLSSIDAVLTLSNTALSNIETAVTNDLSVEGTSTDNGAAPTTLLPVIPAVAKASDRSLTEGNGVTLRTLLNGDLVITLNGEAVATNSDANIAPGTAPSKALIGGGVYNATEPSPSTGQTMALQQDAKGRLRGVIMDAAGNTRGANVDSSNRLSTTLDNIASAVLATMGAGATGSAVPANAVFQGLSDGTNLRGHLQAANALNSTGTGLATAQMIAQFDDTSPTSITENQFGNMRMSANRNLYSTIRDAAGNERGANVNSSNQLSVSVDSCVSHAVTNAGTFVVQENGAALTSLQLIDDAIATTASAITTKGMAVSGTDGTNARVLKTDTSGELQIDVLSIAAGDNNIGNVDIVTMPNVTLAAGTNTNEMVGDAAHDAPIAGNPVRIGGRALTTDYTAVAAGDTADIATTLTGKQLTYPFALPGQTWSYAAASGGIVNTTGVTIKAAGGAGVRNYITCLTVINGHATTSTDVQIRDGASGTVLWRGWAQAAGGGVREMFNVPLRGSANTLLEVACGTTGAAVYVDAQGFTAAE